MPPLYCWESCRKSGLVSALGLAVAHGKVVVLQGTMFSVEYFVLLYWLIGAQATSIPAWFNIARVMSVPVLPEPAPESTKPMGVVEVAAPGLPTLLKLLNGAQRVPSSKHTSIGWIAT